MSPTDPVQQLPTCRYCGKGVTIGQGGGWFPVPPSHAVAQHYACADAHRAALTESNNSRPADYCAACEIEIGGPCVDCRVAEIERETYSPAPDHGIPPLMTFAEAVIDEANERQDDPVWQQFARMATNALNEVDPPLYRQHGLPECPCGSKYANGIHLDDCPASYTMRQHREERFQPWCRMCRLHWSGPVGPSVREVQCRFDPDVYHDANTLTKERLPSTADTPNPATSSPTSGD